MLDRVKEVLFNNRRVVENFSYLSLLQGVNILIPLVMYPYLIRTIGSEKYGLVIYAQGIIAYFVLIVNFGFNISGTKLIAQSKNNPILVSEILSSIYTIKTIFTVLSFALLFVCVFFIEELRNNSILYLLTFHTCLFEAYFPIWYFQGIEKMKYIAIFNVVGRIIYVVLVLLFINESSDYIKIPILNGIITLIVILSSNYIIFIKQKNVFKVVSVEKILFYLKESFDFFLSNGMVAFKERSNVFILGTFISMRDVALYDFISKIIQLARTPFMMLRDAVFPHYARSSTNQGSYNKVIGYSFIISFFIYLVIIYLYPWAEKIIGGEELSGGIRYYIYLGLFIPLGIYSMFLGTGIIIQNRRKLYRKSITNSIVVYFVGICILYFTNRIGNIYALISVFIFSLVVESVYRSVVYKWNN